MFYGKDNNFFYGAETHTFYERPIFSRDKA